MTCAACGASNSPGRKFCGECGARLAVSCPACGAPNEPDVKFCGECGNPLVAEAPATRPDPAAERRLVSVLFVDLVGFTTISESRDPEEVRELLSRYFDTARRLVSLYGGTIEKFIGDAVMAVWGTPVAQEDDAERAVRAALDLTEAVAGSADAPGLRARAGVLTGEAAVTLGATGQGMVAGDLVNTASRIQSAAPPGAVLVGEATRRATAAAIAYESAGLQEVRGKSEPLQLYRALRVVASRGGHVRSSGLEAPFVGRDRELRLVKDLFHATSEEGRAHLLSVVGVAGVGKSRLSWELEKYADGLIDTVWWHRGRCPAYGEGVTYWALAEMVRMRAGIAEGEEPASAAIKLRAAVERHVADREEREWIEPRLAHLLGLEEGAVHEREDLFAAWRLLFERLAEIHPVVMVFEDLQWADMSLLEFVDHLLEWARDRPLFILTLARPEFFDRRPGWGGGHRTFTTVALEPLSREAMEDLLHGLAPGLPDELRSSILERAEGIPLYAVETVRMLLDRGLLVERHGRFEPASSITDLEVPETLHALIAARLDGLDGNERRLVQEAAVLGKTFSLQAVCAVSGLAAEDVEPVLRALVGKEVLLLQSNPRSPERGQFGFLQDLVRRVAYETLSRKERKTLHLAAAVYLDGLSVDEGEMVQVVASHYLDANALAPDAADAPEIRERAVDALSRAGERTASLGASGDAERHFEQAAEMAADPIRRALLLERAGEMAWAASRNEQAVAHYEAALGLLEPAGQSHPAARVSARLAEIQWDLGHIEEGLHRMERSFEVLKDDPPDEDLATLAAQLGRLYFFHGDLDAALGPLETALAMAESLWLPAVLSEAINTKAVLLGARGRYEEGLALYRHALELALEHDVPAAAFRAFFNLGHELSMRDRHDEALELSRRGVALARKLGNRQYELNLLGPMAAALVMKGDWDAALEHFQPVHEAGYTAGMIGLSRTMTMFVKLAINRGEVALARERAGLLEVPGTSGGVLERIDYRTSMAIVLQAEGDHAGAIEAAEASWAAGTPVGHRHEGTREAWLVAMESALALGETQRAQTLLADLEGRPAPELSPYMRGHAHRFRARLGAPDRAEAELATAIGLFREIDAPFPLAVALLERAEALETAGRREDTEELLQEARAIFDRLKARPWLDRVARLRAPAAPVA
jgi:class 3 adenylate cyclase/tetratricopeptide (TPR) repeat protein